MAETGDPGQAGDPGGDRAEATQRGRSRWPLTLMGLLLLLVVVGVLFKLSGPSSAQTSRQQQASVSTADATALLTEGQQTFRFDTFGDQAFWGDTLQLHKAIEGGKLGGVGPGVSPRTALTVGLKVDVDALPDSVRQALQQGTIDLDDPAVTLALLKLNAVVGLTGFFDSGGSLRSVGIQCALCHSTVDDSFAPGIGHRLDAWANRDLNVGAIVSLAPNLQPVASFLGTNVATVKLVAPAPAPGSFDPVAAARGKLLFDGKAQCSSCHVPPLFTEPGWNLHRPSEIGVDSFQADRAPDHRYRTAPLKGLWTHQKGGFFHDGRFATLTDVVNHYDDFFQLGLTPQQKQDLVQYLLSL